jgi:hypothetical protein
MNRVVNCLAKKRSDYCYTLIIIATATMPAVLFLSARDVIGLPMKVGSIRTATQDDNHLQHSSGY